MADKTQIRWSDDALTEAGGQTVWMSPDDYLRLAPKLEGKPYESKKGRELKDSVDAGDEVNQVPSLTVKKGLVTAQDGRHRALAAKDSGIRMIPVRLDGDKIQEDREIMGMQGAKVKLSGPPRAWEDVVKDKEFRRLNAEDREAARRQYFDEVVAPRLSTADVDEARSQFEEDTRTRRAPRAMAEQPSDPTEGMSAGQRFTASFGRLLPQLGQAGGKLARDVLEGTMGGGDAVPAKVGGLEAPPIGEAISDKLGLTTSADIAETRQRDTPLLETTAGAAGDVARNLAVGAPMAMLPGGASVLGAAGYGAGFGLTVPAENWAERGQNVAASGAVSGGVTGAVRSAPALWRSFGSPLFESGRDRMALDSIARFAKDPNAVRNALARPAPPGAPAIDELIPGSRATLAEVTGDPRIAQAQRVVQAASPDAANVVADLRTSRLAARKNALLTTFGVGDKESLEATRESIANKLYRKAWETPISNKAIRSNAADMKELLARPSIQRSRMTVLELAREEGEVLSASDLRGGSVKGLHYMKKALDGQISLAKRSGDDNLARVLMGTRSKLVGVLDELSPSYKKANEEFAKASKPINQ